MRELRELRRYYPDFNKLYVVRWWYDLARLCRDTTVTSISRPAASVARYIIIYMQIFNQKGRMDMYNTCRMEGRQLNIGLIKCRASLTSQQSRWRSVTSRCTQEKKQFEVAESLIILCQPRGPS